MPKKILLADDSMTAQKMGKEILTGAGYEVVAVSNGAAAAKKLADKYAVIILDINMPGYTGFELCEKVRASMDMAKTPVLLTIGKMEHYEPTEVQRVKADGVIIKPFEATDLLATVGKLIEKSAPAQPEYEKTVIMKRADIAEFKDQSYNEWKQDSEPEPEPVKKTIEMSHADASAPAFGMDMDEHLTPAPEPTPAASAFSAAAPSADVAASGFEMSTAPLTSVESSNIESLLAPPAPAFEEVAAQPIPIAPPTFSSTSSRDPMFEAPASEKSDEYAIPAKDPALAAREEMTNEEFIAKTPAPEAEVSAPSSDAEFEARVAAAMSTGYEEAHEVVEAEPEEEDVHAEPAEEIRAAAVQEVQPAEAAVQPTSGMMAEPPDYERTIKIERAPDLEISGQTSQSVEVEIAPDPMIERSYESPTASADDDAASVPDQLLVEQMQAAVQDMPVAPHVEEPVVEASAQTVEMAAPAAPAATSGQDLELANALAAAVGGETSSTMAAAASASSSRTTSVDHNVIAAAVHRAMTKMMPAIMSEVAKELDPEKK